MLSCYFCPFKGLINEHVHFILKLFLSYSGRLSFSFLTCQVGFKIPPAFYRIGVWIRRYVSTLGKCLACISKSVSAARVLCVCLQSCPALHDPVDCGPPGSSVHGISRARVLERVAILFSRGSSGPRD